MNMLDLPLAMRPREKLLNLGPETLSDAELLAVLLGTGLAGKGVMEMAQGLLDHFGGLANLLNADAKTLGRIPGLGGIAKRSQLMAVLELARRGLAQLLRKRSVIDSRQTLHEYIQLHLGNRGHEVFCVMFLDSQHRLIMFEEMFRGTLDQTSVYPREVVVRTLYHEAAAVVLAHNHPSGEMRASPADATITRRLVAALELFEVKVLDHIIVGPGCAMSMRQQGLM